MGYGDKPFLIASAPNGARKTKADLPNIPITPAEVARTALECKAAGASMMHLHVRDEDQKHSLDVGRYREMLTEVRSSVGDDMLLQVTTEAVGIYTAQQQMEMIRNLLPEAVSIAVREIAPVDADLNALKSFFEFMREAKIAPQLILYAPEDVARFNQLVEIGVLPGDKFPVLFVLGRYTAGQVSQPIELLPFIGASPYVSEWMLCAFGPYENACILTGAGLGGHARIGFENNHLRVDGSAASNNADLIAQAHDGSILMGRKIATGEQARQIMQPMW
ncbi:MAG: 3-keto-5-aminohexanoate cleavage protein [Thalassospira sp.]|uniref:3-keto-5-aminohexanoate cleavage protein n=1 Tax=Thalassospira sp. TaxID=1912094 RepID=UPI001AFD0431|nr:3-keto-5-aminohexanoate cleavage protein [Thalassospira sp.]MBO6581160.1 3-keto-5-aminohexanoate cleavage protein [Thalassospira sp.]MBO6802958.1 3-keto-5-aminohexanoate cleavage protein [Thalassospira sp.]MBO6816940.1 3-keto-5-aminohexanoate cleavage protein [Thalassospira sp.]MBO6886925.1 3-keto-5-aminohexanoate cleavage protein [Thalassospira sp.]